MWQILKFLPRKALSRGTGHFVSWEGPRWWNQSLIKGFASMYGIETAEAEKTLAEYPSLGEFFVRRLKPEARPIAEGYAVHCADAQILQNGTIDNGRCVQAKGKTFSVEELLVDPNWAAKFRDGEFVTYYLCPTDYHRVHSPVDGVIRRIVHVPGDLWPVHRKAVNSIEGLYLVNERVVIEISTALGACAVVFVGATNVGSIELSVGSLQKAAAGEGSRETLYPAGLDVTKGQELGMFRMGSTVVVLFSEEVRRKYAATFKIRPRVRVNSALT